MANRIRSLLRLIEDFIKKCTDDHVAPFGAMSAFFMLLSIFPFLIFLLTLTQYMPFTKYDVIHVLNELASFENSSFINGIVNEVYGRAGRTVSTLSLVVALWSSSRGVYSIIIGLNSVYDIDENRNYLVLRLISMVYTFLFAIIIGTVLIVWVFGNSILDYAKDRWPFLSYTIGRFIEVRTLYSVLILTIIFMLVYRYIPNRKSSFWRQLPGALLCTLSWIFISYLCSLYVRSFTNFNYLYGSMAGVMILLLWFYWCMSMVFYGAEINYFLENSKNYHQLVSIIRPRYNRRRRAREKALTGGQKEKKQEKEEENVQD